MSPETEVKIPSLNPAINELNYVVKVLNGLYLQIIDKNQYVRLILVCMWISIMC